MALEVLFEDSKTKQEKIFTLSLKIVFCLSFVTLSGNIGIFLLFVTQQRTSEFNKRSIPILIGNLWENHINYESSSSSYNVTVYLWEC